MRKWVDEKTGMRMCEPDCCDEWLELIWMIAVDYDGCRTVEGLRSLVDEIVEMSQKARLCLHEGRLFTCGSCDHFMGLGDWNLCCDLPHPEAPCGFLCYQDTPACKDFVLKKEKTNEDSR